VLLAVTGVGNAVPVISDAIAPVPPAIPTPSSAPIPRITAPKLAASIAKPAPAKIESAKPAPAANVTEPLGAPPQFAPLPKISRATSEATFVRVSANVVESMRVDLQGENATQMRRISLVTVDAPAPAAPRAHSDSLIDALASAGYGHLSVDELVELSDSGISGRAVAEYARVFGHPSIDELKSLAQRGVSPAYVERIEAAGLHSLTVRDALRLADNGISPRDVSNALRILRSAPSVDDIIRLHNSGVE
jgi:hypothetical protein